MLASGCWLNAFFLFLYLSTMGAVAVADAPSVARPDAPITDAPITDAAITDGAIEGRPGAEELIRRRATLAKRLGDGLVVLDARGEGEGESVDRDFFYLAGCETGGARLLLRCTSGEPESVLFLPPQDAGWELWHGPRLVPGEAAKTATGVDRTLPLADFPRIFSEWSAQARVVWMPVDADSRPGTQGPNSELVLGLGPPVDGVTRVVDGYAEAVHHQRQLKSDYEITRLREAIDITHQGIQNGWGRAREGVWEYQVQAAIEGTFLDRGSPAPGFGSIIAAGPSACIYHYQQNRRQIGTGELMLVDVGATSGGYTADITRTFPVSGTFSKRQREVYQTVLAAQKAGIATVRPGATFRDIHNAVLRVYDEAGFDAKRWYRHGTCHHVGLEVHDVMVEPKLAPGMVITVEPGLYLTEEGLGVRIEDMVLVTVDGCEVLSSEIPKDPDVLEALVRERQAKTPTRGPFRR